MILIPVKAHVRNGKPVRASARNVAGALRFAAERHRGQTRADGSTPYIEHPASVVRILRARGYPEHVQAAAALHDVVEDTGTTLAEIAERFGDAVAILVDHVTDPPGMKDADRRIRQLAHVKKMPRDAQAVKLADRIANLHDTIHNPPGWSADKLRRYYDHSEALVDAAGDAHPGLAGHLRSLIRMGREKMEKAR